MHAVNTIDVVSLHLAISGGSSRSGKRNLLGRACCNCDSDLCIYVFTRPVHQMCPPPRIRKACRTWAIKVKDRLPCRFTDASRTSCPQGTRPAGGPYCCGGLCAERCRLIQTTFLSIVISSEITFYESLRIFEAPPAIYPLKIPSKSHRIFRWFPEIIQRVWRMWERLALASLAMLLTRLLNSL